MVLSEGSTVEASLFNSATGFLLRTRPRDVWLRGLDEAGVPSSPLHTLGELSERQ